MNSINLKKSRFIQGIVFFLIPLLVLDCRKKEEESIVVARVGNNQLTRETVQHGMIREGLDTERENEFVERWVDRELLYQEAKRLGLDKSEEVRSDLEMIEKEYLINKLIERTFGVEISITDEEVTAYYEQNKDLFLINQDEVRILHLITENKSDADLALKEIQAGKSFEEVAESRSNGLFSDRGGDMGYIHRDDVIPEIARRAFRYQIGYISPVFRSPYGYHIIKIMDKQKKGEYRGIEEVREEILQRVRIEKERTTYYDLLFRLRNKTEVYVSGPKEKTISDTMNVESPESVKELSSK